MIKSDAAFICPKEEEVVSKFSIWVPDGGFLGRDGELYPYYTEDPKIFFEDLESVEKAVETNLILRNFEVHEIAEGKEGFETLRRMRRAGKRIYNIIK